MTQKKEPSRHDRLCKICNHPLKEDIEKDYLNWITPEELSIKYKLSVDSVRRHIRATGLSDARAKNKKNFLNRVMEKSLDASKVNASDGINAAKLVMQADGELIDKSETKVQIDGKLETELAGIDTSKLSQLLELITKALEDGEGN
jgi:hypothetical protein